MFETISDGQTDLLAWIRLCKQLGYANIGCIAHSLGAVKVSYALAHGGLDHQRLGLQRFVALSPPRLNTELLSMDPAKREIFDQQLQEAQQWCDKGFPHHIMRIRFPLANWVSAETFMDKYGSGLKYDYFAWWSAIGVPTLWVFGQQEVRQGSVNFRDMDQQLEQVFRNQQVLDHRLAVIPQADHSYRGQRDPLAESIQGWVQSF